MNRRRLVQQQHERAVVERFVTWLNRRRGTKFRVIAEPNPPEAIIQSPRRTSWIEVVDVFWTSKYAQDLFSYATPGEQHQAVRPGPYVDMDEQFALRFVAAIGKKLRKRSYLPLRENYGPGYLVASAHNPFFGDDTLSLVKQLWAARRPWEDLGCFKEIYLEDSMLGSSLFRRWRI